MKPLRKFCPSRSKLTITQFNTRLSKIFVIIDRWKQIKSSVKVKVTADDKTRWVAKVSAAGTGRPHMEGLPAQPEERHQEVHDKQQHPHMAHHEQHQSVEVGPDKCHLCKNPNSTLHCLSGCKVCLDQSVLTQPGSLCIVIYQGFRRQMGVQFLLLCVLLCWDLV